MRYNKQELAALASQTSHNFDHEGVLVLKEKQDGFFRRSEGEDDVSLTLNTFFIDFWPY